MVSDIIYCERESLYKQKTQRLFFFFSFLYTSSLCLSSSSRSSRSSPSACHVLVKPRKTCAMKSLRCGSAPHVRLYFLALAMVINWQRWPHATKTKAENELEISISFNLLSNYYDQLNLLLPSISAPVKYFRTFPCIH